MRARGQAGDSMRPSPRSTVHPTVVTDRRGRHGRVLLRRGTLTPDTSDRGSAERSRRSTTANSEFFALAQRQASLAVSEDKAAFSLSRGRIVVYQPAAWCLIRSSAVGENRIASSPVSPSQKCKPAVYDRRLGC